ncbi:alpha/beta fold hydrolase [Variovorax humicola]|uniref:Alpha/beta fold hydrolase n=1 Tax=Variovorax humicola TaxID=1769758 RepID=A0ABU8VV55_9BURK
MKNIDSSFESKGLRCAGTLLLPGQGECPPVIVMAHGFAGVRAMLMPHARRFVEAGYAVYLFDYRSFGDSEGQPRHWVDPFRHLEDWDAAIRHVKSLPQVDGERMVLWGTSLSGGHVVCMAARGHRIAAVIAGHPLMSGLAAVAHMPFLKVLRLTLAGLRDLAGSLIGRPHYLPVVGRPGDLAVLTGPEAWGGMQQLQAIVDGPWENKVLARVALKIPRYNPIRKARGVRVPTLVIAGANDSIVSAQVARKAAGRMADARFTLHASDHFQPYYGDFLEENVRTQLAFLRKQVAL